MVEERRIDPADVDRPLEVAIDKLAKPRGVTDQSRFQMVPGKEDRPRGPVIGSGEPFSRGRRPNSLKAIRTTRSASLDAARSSRNDRTDTETPTSRNSTQENPITISTTAQAPWPYFARAAAARRNVACGGLRPLDVALPTPMGPPQDLVYVPLAYLQQVDQKGTHVGNSHLRLFFPPLVLSVVPRIPGQQ